MSLRRLGAEGFQRLFNQPVDQARAKGLVSDRIHIIDATHMTAKMDLLRLKKAHQYGDYDDHYVDRNSPYLRRQRRVGNMIAQNSLKNFYNLDYTQQKGGLGKLICEMDPVFLKTEVGENQCSRRSGEWYQSEIGAEQERGEGNARGDGESFVDTYNPKWLAGKKRFPLARHYR
ncbi:MAG: hypothetical protein ACYC6G_08215 [Desulfobaccales bacterium]